MDLNAKVTKAQKQKIISIRTFNQTYYHEFKRSEIAILGPKSLRIYCWKLGLILFYCINFLYTTISYYY